MYKNGYKYNFVINNDVINYGYIYFIENVISGINNDYIQTVKIRLNKNSEYKKLELSFQVGYLDFYKVAPKKILILKLKI